MSKILVNAYHLGQNTERQKRPRRRARKMSPEELVFLRFLATLIDYDCAAEPGWYRLRKITRDKIAEALDVGVATAVDKIKRATWRGHLRKIKRGHDGYVLEMSLRAFKICARLNDKRDSNRRRRAFFPNQPRSTSTMGFVYFIRSAKNGGIKIGFTTRHPQARLSELQTASPDSLEMLGFHSGTRSDEKQLHERFAQYRVRERSEWFRPAKPLLEYIKSSKTIV